ncbi:MAG TPA: hypothetical protein VLA29_00495 [Acidimicrobiia bacterium]|nr:hypothetical protein [Acidimicrobiia bacterium]
MWEMNMNGWHTNDIATTEMTWEVDGEEYRLVRLSDIPSGRSGQVEFLQEVLGCTEREAEYAYRVIVEDGEFIASVRGDIDGLPDLDSPRDDLGAAGS